MIRVSLAALVTIYLLLFLAAVFKMAPAPSPNDALTWASATFEFGTDLTVPPGAAERAP